MSSNPSRILDQLVDQSPLTEPPTTNNNSKDERTVTNGIIRHGAPTIPSTIPSTIPTEKPKPKGNICPGCRKPVYFAEEIKAAGQSFHKFCYRCANCDKSINGANFSEHNGKIYDNNCYRRLFGPKGVGYGMSAGALSTDK
ncbi:unnamed protein product [Adineta steineri]|uniref:LIM zinc-binding domain-containing protein n=1 Tax=Adineta steineri TaxID=433720 RepID=A0A815T4W5_9BILA|nr:unnamed protein product [Adineta steineri]